MLEEDPPILFPFVLNDRLARYFDLAKRKYFRPKLQCNVKKVDFIIHSVYNIYGW